jgi:hypothetical protein
MNDQREDSGSSGGGKRSIYKVGGVFCILVGGFNLISLPFAPAQDKLVFDLMTGLFLLGGGIWLLAKGFRIRIVKVKK